MFVKGQKVMLPYHNCEGTINCICGNEIYVKCDNFGVWCDTDGFLPYTELKIITDKPKFNIDELCYYISRYDLAIAIVKVKVLEYKYVNQKYTYRIMSLVNNTSIIVNEDQLIKIDFFKKLEELCKIRQRITKPDK